jgi:hypothetical protein
MPNLLEKLVEVIGDEGKAKEVQSALGEFMLPKTEYAKLRDQLKERETELESIRTSSMSEKEKFEHELAKAQNIQKEYSIKTNRLEAATLFTQAGLSKEAYETLLDKAVSEDRDKTLGLVNDFIGLLGKEKETVANKTKQELIDQTKKPEAGDGDKAKPSTFRTQF